VRGASLHRVAILQLLVLAAATLMAGASHPAAMSAPAGPGVPVLARVHVRDRAHLDAVSGELDIWEVHPDEAYVLAAVGSEQLRWLEELGYRVERLEGRTTAMAASAALDPRFHYFDGEVANPSGRYVVDFLHQIEEAYPQLTELVDIGDAWLADQPGQPDRDIWLLRVTTEDPSLGEIEQKPAFFMAAAMHAREVATTELAIRYVRYLTGGYNGQGGYGRDADVTWLVDHHVAYILLMQNPDGHAENERDVAWNRRKNMDSDDGCPWPAEWGVDLNRNHSFLWSCCGGSSSNPCLETYRGPGPGSEPETRAFESAFSSLMLDQNGPNGNNEIAAASPLTTTGIFISLHSYGDLVLWPWAFDDFGDAPNEAQLRTIGRKFAAYNGYDASGTIWYDVDGAVDDWAYGKLGIASFTFEVGPLSGVCGGFFPAYECIDGYAGRDFWAENLPALLYAHKIARTPYVTAYGPDAEGVNVTASGQPPTAPVQISATIADQRCCGDAPRPVAAAECFVGAPGEGGTGTAMNPTDGAWGGLVEEVGTVLDSSALSPGRHAVLVHGRNVDGPWGPFTAAFLWVGEPTYLPLVVADG